MTIGEFALIDRIAKKISKLAPPNEIDDVLIGIGDDCAVVKSHSNKLFLITTDCLVEDVHFRLKYSKYFSDENLFFRLLGKKALSVNISDISSMCGVPKYAVITISLTDKIKLKNIDALYSGMIDIANKYNIKLVGGDTTKSTHSLFISITLTGEVKKNGLSLRSSAKSGDAVLVTGTLGDSGMGLKILEKGTRHKTHSIDYLINRHLNPTPRFFESQVISSIAKVNSMIDISDGLSSEINHIAKMSNTGAIIYEDKIPISNQLKNVAKMFNVSPYELALSGGEDYELLFTVQKKYVDKIIDAVYKSTKTKVSIIGEITSEKDNIILIDKNGKEKELKARGYDHFN